MLVLATFSVFNTISATLGTNNMQATSSFTARSDARNLETIHEILPVGWANPQGACVKSAICIERVPVLSARKENCHS